MLRLQGRVALLCETAALAGMAPFVIGEVRILAAHGLAGWLSAWNALDSLTYALQASGRRGGDSNQRGGGAAGQARRRYCMPVRPQPLVIHAPGRPWASLHPSPPPSPSLSWRLQLLSPSLPAPSLAPRQVAISVLHLGTWAAGPAALTVVVAVQAIVLTIRLTYFSRVFRFSAFDFMGSLQARTAPRPPSRQPPA
jgi:hypothetical protein